MPVVNRSIPSPLNLATGVPVGPGVFSIPEANEAGATLRYEYGDVPADRTWNSDGLNLSVEARLRAGRAGAATVERLQVSAGVEGLQAKVDLVQNGEAHMSFQGLSMKEGFFKGQAEEARDYLKENPALATAAVVGTVVVAHQYAKKNGPIAFEAGQAKLYDKNGLTATVSGDLALTGDNKFVRAEAATLNLDYRGTEAGDFSLKARYERDHHARVEGTWSKNFDTAGNVKVRASYDTVERGRVDAGWSKNFKSGWEAHGSAFYEEKNNNAGVYVGASLKF